MASRSFFVTGTDTGSGKTLVSVLLLQAFKASGERVYGMKPVASGCRQSASGLVSEDAERLIDNSSSSLPYALVNPVALASPCSPNIAAVLEGRQIDPGEVLDAYQQIASQAGVVIVEGIGGWRTPVFGTTGMSIIVRQLNIPVVLVVGLRLGCISHAMLTYEALKSDNIKIAGWIATQVDTEFTYVNETVACLQESIDCKLLGQIPYLPDQGRAVPGSYLDLSPLKA